jgi:hypothetical protein
VGRWRFFSSFGFFAGAMYLRRSRVLGDINSLPPSLSLSLSLSL